MTEKGLYDIYSTWHVPFWQTNWFYLLIGVFISLIILFIVYLIVKKIRFRPKKQLPFWQQALHAIEQLKKENKITVVQGKEFYAQLTAILKRYIALRFHVDVQGKTDDELIAYLSDKKLFDAKLLQNIKSIFSGSVTIKFANTQAAQEQMERDYRNAIEFVKKTCKAEEKE